MQKTSGTDICTVAATSMVDTYWHSEYLLLHMFLYMQWAMTHALTNMVTNEEGCTMHYVVQNIVSVRIMFNSLFSHNGLLFPQSIITLFYFFFVGQKYLLLRAVRRDTLYCAGTRRT